MSNLTYRGEALPDIETRTDSDIAELVRCAAQIDRELNRALVRYSAKHKSNKSACSTVDAFKSWLDLGLASIASAEYRQQVSIYTKRQNV